MGGSQKTPLKSIKQKLVKFPLNPPILTTVEFACQEPELDWVHSDLEDELVNLREEESLTEQPTQDILNLLPLVQCN